MNTTTEKSSAVITCDLESSDPSYFSEISSFSRLSKDDEQELAHAWCDNNDNKARERLIVSNLTFVVYIAKGYSGYRLPLHDLIQEGNVGLIKAVDRFDPTRGHRLVTYAVNWIRAAIQEYVIGNTCQVKIATTPAQRKLFFRLRGLRKYNSGCLSGQEIREIAETLSVSEKDVVEMEKRLYTYDIAMFHDDGPEDFFSPEKYIPDENAIDPLDEAIQAFRRIVIWAEVEEALSSIDRRRSDIIKRRILSKNPLTLRELALVYGVSAERIRQLETTAILDLRRRLRKYNES